MDRVLDKYEQAAQDYDRREVEKLRSYLMRRYPGAVMAALGRSESVADVAIDLLGQYEQAQEVGRRAIGEDICG